MQTQIPRQPTTTSGGAIKESGASVRVPQLDGLRAIAILLVLVWHYFVRRNSGETPALDWLNHALSLTWSGVDLFFVLSGFLIGGILLDNAKSDRYYSTFYIRRSCRILPVYFIFILPLFAAAHLPLPEQWKATLEQPFSIWLYPFFVQNFGMAIANQIPSYSGVTWSLAIEEQFYLLLPLLMRNVARRHIPVLCLGGIIVAVLTRFLSLRFLGDNAAITCYVMLPTRSDSLFIGVACAWLVRHQSSVIWLNARSRALKLFLYVSAVALGFLSFFTHFGSNFVSGVGYTLFGTFYGTVLLVTVTQPTLWISRLLSGAILRPIATASYTIYLVHVPVENAVHQLISQQKPNMDSWQGAALQVLALATTLFVAWISWALLESKAIKFGQRYKY